MPKRINNKSRKKRTISSKRKIKKVLHKTRRYKSRGGGESR